MMEVRFFTHTVSGKLYSCIVSAELKLTENSDMIKYVRSRNDWKYNSGTGERVATELLKKRTPVSVYVVKKTRKTSAIAYFQNGDIYLYADYLEAADEKSIVATLIHEYAHHCGFNHYSSFGTSNFKTKHKVKYSVPYNLSDSIEKGLF